MLQEVTNMFEKNDEFGFAEKPPLALYSLIKKGISDDDYISLMLRFATQCCAKFTIDESPDSYHFHLYLKGSFLLGDYAYNWVQLIQESDAHELSVFCSSPQIIKATFIRSKYEKSE